MARRTPTSTRNGGKTAAPADESAAAPAAPAASGKGMTFNDVLVITSTLLLLAAVLMTDYVHGTRYNGGWFFKP
jgi:hypothetical protein